MTVLIDEQGAGSGRRRFIAPSFDAVAADCFKHPLFSGLDDFRPLLSGPRWPTLDQLNALLPTAGSQRFVEQDATLLADGLHYESRIAQGRIATRLQNWHDLFNALIWVRYPAIKQALNAQQCRHVKMMGSGRRNAAQQALTQFDETGVVIRVRNLALIAAWDAHDWSALFLTHAQAWRDGEIAVAGVIGHALMEQALLPGRLLVGKCVVVCSQSDAQAVDSVADAIERGELLQAAAELRPLPLAGIPGWQSTQDEAFYAKADYFRPLREGRRYPAPLLSDGASAS